MANLIDMAIRSLDSYLDDESGNFDWAIPDEEVHTFMNDLLKSGRDLSSILVPPVRRTAQGNPLGCAL